MVEIRRNEGFDMPDTPNMESSPMRDPLSAMRIHTHAEPPIFPSYWSPDRPIVLDVGCHRGTFLVSLAETRPDHDILGIERQSSRVTRVLRKIERLGLPNAWALQGEAYETLKRLPAARAAEIHILFPDPWPKRRHAPRRLVNTEFLVECARVLHPVGLLRIVTDDAPYFEQVRQTAATAEAFTPSTETLVFPETEFQKKFIEQGKPFFEIVLHRKTS